ncbi:glycosyltransferase family 4 protein [Stieleria sp. JC731]|nr:glycosyltransferase family 4 protein [Stieleria sp. JC731]MCC9601235.1 glycosyltransferase family 4 protein [Stieleria sp. JC731]
MRILAFMGTSSPVGGVSTWLDHFSDACETCQIPMTVALVKGDFEHDPDQFREYHPNLNSIIVDGRGLTEESRIRACQRIIRKTNPTMVLPLGVMDANAATVREKRRRALHLVSCAHGNLPPMLADLEDLRDAIDHVVCVGALTRRYLIEHGNFLPQRVSHIPNGSREPIVPWMPTSIDSPIRLGYIGRLTKGDKRVLDIPVLCDRLQDLGARYHLSIVGSGPAEAELRSQVKRFGNSVTMHGPMTSDQVYRDVFPNLDLLLLFSSSESFGIVLAEAMINRVVPVTARYVGYHSEGLVVDNIHGRSFEIGDMDQAAKIIIDLAKEPAKRNQLASRAQQHAIQKYRWPACMDDWMSLISEIHQTDAIRPSVSLCRPRQINNGRLDRMGVPTVVSDQLRRIRRKFHRVQASVGQEWPLFRRDHPQQRLAKIHVRTQQVDERSQCQDC